MVELKECDIVMQGGITSGVVYPHAILVLKDKYRFRSIGGTSAGAIAAGVAAATEFGRSRGGFDRLADVSKEMATVLESLFQPVPSLKKLFGVFLAISKGGLPAAVAQSFKSYWEGSLAGILAGLVVGGLAAWLGTPPPIAVLLGLTSAIIGASLFVIFWLGHELFDVLRSNNFGLCDGVRQPGYDKPGLSDWFAEILEECACRPLASDNIDRRQPLTFGDLLGAKIDLRMMTTNLSLGLGVALPGFGGGTYLWRVSEFEKVLPKWVVDHMVRVTQEWGADSSYRHLPSPSDLPVVAAIRLSLSFPVLIAAVPLHVADDSLPSGTAGVKAPRRVLFSDGGISRNFPVQFFDSLLPARPTFGISLDAFGEDGTDLRVHLPMDAREKAFFPVASTDTLVGFGMAIFNTAKDWETRKLASLTGFRERISHVYLKPDEGGLNLDMSKPTVNLLDGLGGRAGDVMAGAPQAGDQYAFDFGDHQWRRFLISYTQIEQLMNELRDKWGSLGKPGDFANTISQVSLSPPSYSQSTPAWRQDVIRRFDALMASSAIMSPPIATDKDSDTPPVAATLQVVPND